MDQDYLWSYQFLVDCESIWFVPYWYNVLCKYNMQTEELAIMKQLPRESAAEGLYINLVKIDDFLVLMPIQSGYIYIYEIEKNQVFEIQISEETTRKNHVFAYGIWKNDLYMFTKECSVVFKLNIYNRKVSTIYLKSFKLAKDSEASFLLQSYVVENMVYMIIQNSNCILRFDMETENGFFVHVGNPKDYYLSICKVRPDRLLMVNQNGEVIIFNENNSKIMFTLGSVSGFYNKNLFKEFHRFIECIEYENYVYFFGGSMVIKVNKDNYEITKAEFSDSLMAEGKKKTTCFSDDIFAVKQNGHCIYVENMYKCSFFRIDMHKKTTEQFVIPIKKTDGYSVGNLSEVYKNITFEGETLYWSLRNMLQHMEKNQEVCKQEQIFGKQIWADIKKKIFRE